MKKPIPFLLQLFLCFFCCPFFIHAQEATTATGGEATGSGGTASYTVGQVAYITNNSTDFSEAQGVQQPFEISLITNLVEPNGQPLEVSLFPNPAVDQLTLSVKGITVDQMTYELLDLQGRRLASQALTAEQTVIAVNHLPAATYLLKVIQEQQTVSIFKILKN